VGKEKGSAEGCKTPKKRRARRTESWNWGNSLSRSPRSREDRGDRKKKGGNEEEGKKRDEALGLRNPRGEISKSPVNVERMAHVDGWWGGGRN